MEPSSSKCIIVILQDAIIIIWYVSQIRLDIWHFMRRIARGCVSESHPLYGTFMGSLSSCIFEWDEADFNKLMSAKRGELINAGVGDPSPSAIRKAMKKEELARHCRRRTRGATETAILIEAMLLEMTLATDATGVPLLSQEMMGIWEEQKKHLMCLQDPPGVPLYTMTGSMCKGGVTLPVLRCARGTTSLESFHLHLARYRDPLINMIIHLMSFRFIPGTSANAVHYQAYLLEGVTRWNQARALEAIQQQQPQVLRTFNLRLADKVFILYLVWYTNIKLICLLIHCRSTMPVRDCLEIRSCRTTRLLPNILASSLEYSTSTGSPYLSSLPMILMMQRRRRRKMKWMRMKAWEMRALFFLPRPSPKISQLSLL